jgi:hypothetical protein
MFNCNSVLWLPQFFSSVPLLIPYTKELAHIHLVMLFFSCERQLGNKKLAQTEIKFDIKTIFFISFWNMPWRFSPFAWILKALKCFQSTREFISQCNKNEIQNVIVDENKLHEFLDEVHDVRNYHKNIMTGRCCSFISLGDMSFGYTIFKIIKWNGFEKYELNLRRCCRKTKKF